MKLEVQAEQLGNLFDGLSRYAELTGKKMGDVIAREGREMSWALYKESKKVSPKPGDILRQAESRGWAMGRRKNRLTKSSLGVSVATRERAMRMLSGEKADYFKVTKNGDGMLSVKPVRFSARKYQKRVTKLSTLLRGGRTGYKFAASALRSSKVAGYEIGVALKGNAEIKKLNVGALSAAIEIGNRQKSAKGGLIAAQWMPRVFKRRSSSLLKKGPLVVNSMAAGKLEIGRVDFHHSQGEVDEVTITGNAPGTDVVIERHGILEKAIRTRIADREKFISAKLNEALAESFKKLVSL